MTTTYEDVLTSIGRMSQSPVRDEVLALMREWQTAFGHVAEAAEMTAKLAVLTAKATELVGAHDRKVELEIVKLASENPVLGPTLVLAALPATLARSAATFWTMLYGEQQNKKQQGAPAPAPAMSGSMAGWNIKELPPPGPGRRYIVFSDVHRDARSDRRLNPPPPLAPGSIDHFSANAALYARLLDRVIADPTITILEAGDCEELWFIRSVASYPKNPDGSLNVAAKLEEIVDTHRPIYDRLRTLHGQGRYLRIQGNHDSWVKRDPADDSVRRVLDNAMAGTTGDPNPPPFPIYDACVIPGVKTMMEHAAGEVLKEIARLAVGSTTATDFVNGLIRSHVGLDASVYQERAKMLVAHGHQFDFWNCPANELLGLVISNTVATFVDRHMDRFLDLRGIAWQGNPLVDFENLLAGLPITSSWPKRSPAVARAHATQHMPDSARMLDDSIMYSESVAVIWGAVGLALSGPDQVVPGQPVDPDPPQFTPAESRASLSLASPTDIATYLSRHHFHHVLLGHTHNPQSQPYFGLGNLQFFLMPPASWLLAALRAVLPNMLQPTLKTGYSNSGTAGWAEGVIWATEIDEQGQSRLVYWTEHTLADQPERMDWELEDLDPAVKANLVQALRTVFDAPAAELAGNVDALLERLRHFLKTLNVAKGALEQAIADTEKLPVHILGAALMAQAANVVKTVRQLEELSEKLLQAARGAVVGTARRVGAALKRALEDAEDALKRQLEQVQAFTADVMLTVKRRMLRGFAAAGDVEYLTLYVPISEAYQKKLGRLARILLQPPGASETPEEARLREDAAVHAAGLALAIFDGFPRNMPFFTRWSYPGDLRPRVLASDAPVLLSALSMLWMLPQPGQKLEMGGVALRTRLSLQGGQLAITAVVSEAGAPEPPPEPGSGLPVPAPHGDSGVITIVPPR